MPPDTASLIYAWADHPNRSVIIRNRRLAQISLLSQNDISAGIPIFVHRQRPCLYATIAGIVVGTTTRDWKWEYMIDDGSQLIDVVVQASSIPQSIAPLRKKTSDTSSFALAEPELRLGDLVKVTGKIWRRHWKAREVKVGIDVLSIDILNTNSTAAARHGLEAHELEHGEYNRPFGVLTSAHGERQNGLQAYKRLRVGVLGTDDGDPVTGTGTSTTAVRASGPISSAKENPNHTEEDGIAHSSRRRTRGSGRALRAPSRLKDSECTQSLFRLHVQKFLADFCGDDAGSNGPPAFTISFLRRIDSLAELAERVVAALLSKRAKKLARTSTVAKGTSIGSHPLSTEPEREKIKRLFEWCIRELLLDGFVVIADESESGQLAWPFDGRQKAQKISSQHHRLARLLVADTIAGDSAAPEAYQLVTPCLLRRPLRYIKERHGRPPGNLRPMVALEHLRRSDDRWRHVTCETVEEALLHVDSS